MSTIKQSNYLNLYLIIFLIPLIVNVFGLNIYSVWKTSFFLIILAISLLLLGFYHIKKNILELLVNKWLYLYLITFIASLVISTITWIAPIQSIFGLYKDFIWLIFYLLIIVHFIIILHLFRDKNSINYFFIITKIITLIIVILAILQLFNIDPFVNIDNQEYLFRVYSTIWQPNFLWQFLIFPFFIVLFSLIKPSSTSKYKHFLINWLLLAWIVTVIYLTKNRATYLAISASTLIYFLFFSQIKSFHKKLSLTSFIIIAITAFNIIWINLRSLYSRSFLVDASAQMMNYKNILFWNGLNSFYQKFVEIMPSRVFEYEKFYTTPVHPHNEMIESLVEKWLLWLALYLIPILVISNYISKKPKDTPSLIALFWLLAYYISVQFSFSKIEHFIFLTAFWAIVLINNLELKVLTVNIKNIFKKTLIIASILILWWCCSIWAYRLFHTDILLNKHMSIYINWDSSESIKIIKKAIDYSPFYIYPKKFFISLYLSEINNYPLIKTDINEYLKNIWKLWNQNFDYNTLSLKYASYYKNEEEIDKYLEIWKNISPNLPILYTEAIEGYYKLWNCEKVITNYEKLLSLTPAFYQENINNCNNNEQCRIFLKHADGLIDSREMVNTCID